MLCDGQLLPISENETLFNLIGTTYGGDGQSTFALPDLQSRVPVHMGTGKDSTVYTLAEMAGTEQETLTTQQIAQHTHPLQASADPASSSSIGNNVIATPAAATPFSINNANLLLASQSVTPDGGSQPHENCQPFLCINFIISLFGIFPSQT
jgi:microcystin-dependent protein